MNTIVLTFLVACNVATVTVNCHGSMRDPINRMSGVYQKQIKKCTEFIFNFSNFKTKHGEKIQSFQFLILIYNGVLHWMMMAMRFQMSEWSIVVLPVQFILVE
jgi:hypothetical protein